MAYSFTFRDQALFELAEAYVWYEKKQTGLGRDFRQEISDKIEKIAINPYHYRKAYKNQHEAVVERFPYVVIYSVDDVEEHILILAIFHTSRNPKTKFLK